MDQIAFVFAGQGAQYSGMGEELYYRSSAAKAVFDMADRIRPGTSEQCFNASFQELSSTLNTQPCIYCLDLAAAKALEEEVVSARFAAGFSLGEIAALAYAGAYSIQDGFRIICERSRLMDEIAQEQNGKMAAVLELTDAVVEQIYHNIADIYPVNYNCPGQTVFAGTESAINLLCERVDAAEGRAVVLAVSGAFHSPFMEKAAEGLYDYLQQINISNTKIPVYSNLTAEPYGNQIREQLASQICSPVLWHRTLINMADVGVDTFIEVGPGVTLSRLIKKCLPNVVILNVEDNLSLEKTVTQIIGG